MSFIFPSSTFKMVMHNTKNMGYPFHRQVLVALSAFLSAITYQIKIAVFKWNVDNEQDITLSIFNIIHITKYKESTIFNFGRKNYTPARKHVIAHRE